MRELIDDAEEARAIGNPALASVSLRWGFSLSEEIRWALGED